MRFYCKAYLLKDLREFPAWEEAQTSGETPLTDNTVCYIWDDFTVVTSPIHAEKSIFDQITPEWRLFCETHLQFQIPADLHYAYGENGAGSC